MWYRIYYIQYRVSHISHDTHGILLYRAHYIHFVVVWLLSHAWLFATPRIATRQASLSSTISQRLLRFMSTESSDAASPSVMINIQSTISPVVYSVCEGEVEVLVAQSCPTLCDPMDCSPPGSSVHEISRTRVLEWVASPFSRGSSRSRDWTWVSLFAGRCFDIWATREAHISIYMKHFI